jgi:ABC-type branched-subunit amino acid transport system substrate-binding protein
VWCRAHGLSPVVGVGSQTRIEVYINDSKCAPKPAVESALWQLTQPVPVQAVLGAGCSGASMQSQLVLQVFEVPQVCYGATNPALANKELYPYFLRTIPSDSLQVRPSSRPVLPSG